MEAGALALRGVGGRPSTPSSLASPESRWNDAFSGGPAVEKGAGAQRCHEKVSKTTETNVVVMNAEGEVSELDELTPPTATFTCLDSLIILLL